MAPAARPARRPPGVEPGPGFTAALAQIPPAISALQALAAPITFDQLAGKTHDDMVLDIDGDHDTISPLVATFVHDVTH